MHKPYYWMAPIGGFIRLAKRELQYLDDGFSGLGFPHWGIEAVVEAFSNFFLHFGKCNLLGTQLQMPVELLTIEIGLSPQRFLLDYHQFGDHATNRFCSELWSHLHHFDLCLVLEAQQLSPPCEDDKWLMTVFKSPGFSLQECLHLNLTHHHQQVIFDLDT